MAKLTTRKKVAMPKLTREEMDAVKKVAAIFGRIGGKKGGRARAAALSPERRSEIARNAALARHAKRTKKQRSDQARKAVTARWSKRRKPSKAGKKASAAA